MFQKFFQNTIESKFIQALVNNTYLPNLKIVCDTDYLLEGNIYILNDYIIKCTKTGYVKSDSNQCEYKNVRLFQWAIDRNLVNISTSNTNYYDSNLHKRFGDYLRVIRDSQGIDLMPFYNCFSFYQVEDVRILNNPSDVKNNGIVSLKDTTHKVYAVPIKFNKTYTIALDSSSEVLLKSGFYSEYGLVAASGYPTYNWMYELLNAVEKGPIVKARTCFREPFTYSISNDFSSVVDNKQLSLKMSKDCEAQEKNLYLFIQVPYDNNSTITVLEGNYSDKVNNFRLYGNANQAIKQVGAITPQVEEGETLYKDKYFIFNNNLYKCLQTGIFDPTNLEDKRNGTDIFFYGAGKYPSMDDWILNRYAYNLTDYIQYQAVSLDAYLSSIDPNILSTFADKQLSSLGDDNNVWIPVAQYAKFELVEETSELNSALLTRLSLLSFNTNEQYAFTDTILQYLLLTVVDSTELIDKNISYVQYLLSRKMDGVWDNSLRVEMYNRFNSTHLNNRDNNGNLSRDYDKYFSNNFSKYIISNSDWVARGDS